MPSYRNLLENSTLSANPLLIRPTVQYLELVANLKIFTNCISDGLNYSLTKSDCWIVLPSCSSYRLI